MRDLFRKFSLSAEPLIIMILIGVVLLGAVVYYRAITIQRFLEPALALTQPRMEFSEKINRILDEEFGTEASGGVALKYNAIVVDGPLLFSENGRDIRNDAAVFKKLGNVFLAMLSDPSTRANIDLILINAEFSLGPDHRSNETERRLAQEKAHSVLNALYVSRPGLEKEYGLFFAAAAMPVSPERKKGNGITFRIISTEMMHIEALKRLGKHAH